MPPQSARRQKADDEAAAAQPEYERPRRADGSFGWLPGHH
ncbi:hypothetical protein ABIC27_005785 [Streptomyces sp. PvR034]